MSSVQVGSTKPSASSSIMPLGRIKTIMKSSPDVDNISTDALFAMGKSAELFVGLLAQKAHDECTSNTRIVDYKHLAQVINSDDTFGFLQEIIPHKITVKEYFEILRNDDEEDESSSSQDSDSTATE